MLSSVSHWINTHHQEQPPESVSVATTKSTKQVLMERYGCQATYTLLLGRKRYRSCGKQRGELKAEPFKMLNSDLPYRLAVYKLKKIEKPIANFDNSYL